MGKKFEFKSAGVGSRSYYLVKVRDGANSANKLKEAIHKDWYTAKKAVDILLAEKLIDNVKLGTHPEYTLTEWGTAEAKRFDDWQGPEPDSPKVQEHEEQSSNVAPHKVPVNPAGFVQFIPPGVDETPKPNPPRIPPESPPVYKAVDTVDKYHDAFIAVLIERFGSQVTFQEVQERLAV